MLYRIATVLSHTPSEMSCVPEVPISLPRAGIQGISCAGQDSSWVRSALSAEDAGGAGSAEYLNFGI